MAGGGQRKTQKSNAVDSTVGIFTKPSQPITDESLEETAQED